MKTVVKENANGGKGQVVVKYILDDNELNAKCKMFAESPASRWRNGTARSKIWLILRTVRTTMLSQSSLKPACCHSSSAWMRQCFCPPSAMIFPWIF